MEVALTETLAKAESNLAVDATELALETIAEKEACKKSKCEHDLCDPQIFLVELSSHS